MFFVGHVTPLTVETGFILAGSKTPINLRLGSCPKRFVQPRINDRMKARERPAEPETATATLQRHPTGDLARHAGSLRAGFPRPADTLAGCLGGVDRNDRPPPGIDVTGPIFAGNYRPLQVRPNL
jgi:hypothetical protein